MKKIVLSLGIIIPIIAILIIGATGAFFSDTETSTGNTFTAGSMDLIVDIDGQDQNPLSGPIFSLPDMKPGDMGERTISLKVDNNASCGFVNIDLTSDLDNSCTEPESLDEPGCNPQGTENGELNDLVNFKIWKEADCNNIYEPQNNETILTEGPLTENKAYGIGELSIAPAKMCYGIAYCFGAWGPGMACSGSAVNNTSQTDSFTGNMVITAEQKRNKYPNGCPTDEIIDTPPIDGDEEELPPSVAEVCGDGLDNDVDGHIDEGCVPWINEIHYDNDSTDENEGVEIAGKAGTDLTGWKIYFYNGSGGASYDTLSLSGVIPNQQAGSGTLWFANAGIQNDMDGLALVSPGGTVIKFLSYEGTFTATNGPANSIMSVDIGVSELPNTPGDPSLQLQGTGDEYGDFIWAGPINNTRNAVNTNQTFN